MLADSALAWTQTSGLEGNVPSVTFKVNVEQAGDYYLSVFSNSATAENDSYHVVLNNEYKYASKNAVVNGTSQWGDTVGEGWFYLNNTALHLNAGENTLTIYGRESGVLLRQLVLSTEKLSDLSGWQTATLQ